MNCKIVNALLFTAGVVVGSVATWKFVETKYKRIAQEEIESVKEAFSKNRVENSSVESDEDNTEDDTEDNEIQNEDEVDPQDEMYAQAQYEAEIRRLGYASASNQEKGGGEPVYLAPYVITPDEFGEDGYDTAMLSYYADGVLEDEYWNVVDNIEDVIGKEFEDRFGEYANDTVFIRNEQLHTDYEVTYDRCTHAESQMYSPYGVGGDA